MQNKSQKSISLYSYNKTLSCFLPVKQNMTLLNQDILKSSTISHSFCSTGTRWLECLNFYLTAPDYAQVIFQGNALTTMWKNVFFMTRLVD